MTRLLKFFLLVVSAGFFGVSAWAQGRSSAEMADLRYVRGVGAMPAAAAMPAAEGTPVVAEMPLLEEIPIAEGMPASEGADNPVAEVRERRMWELGPLVSYGRGVGDRSDFNFVMAGFKVGKPLTPVLNAGILSGQFELGGNIMPLWLAFTPSAHIENRQCLLPGGGTTPCQLPIGGGNYHGFSMTPVILRWNFLTKSRRWQPWFQGAGGLIYTTHKFPPDVLVTHGLPGGTSVWNFTPQGGMGIHYFTRARRSIDFGVNAVHISSASLGDRNPGVNASVQFQVDYTFWK